MAEKKQTESDGGKKNEVMKKLHNSVKYHRGALHVTVNHKLLVLSHHVRQKKKAGRPETFTV